MCKNACLKHECDGVDVPVPYLHSHFCGGTGDNVLLALYLHNDTEVLENAIKAFCVCFARTTSSKCWSLKWFSVSSLPLSVSPQSTAPLFLARTT